MLLMCTFHFKSLEIMTPRYGFAGTSLRCVWEPWKVNISIHDIFYQSQASIQCINFHNRLTSSFEIKKIVNDEKGNNSKMCLKYEKSIRYHFEIFIYVTPQTGHTSLETHMSYGYQTMQLLVIDQMLFTGLDYLNYCQNYSRLRLANTANSKNRNMSGIISKVWQLV